MSRNCLECNETLIGRIDKKFCSDQCRNTYNNRQNGSSNNYVRSINNILRKNRRILETVNPGEKTKTTRDRLLREGFNFQHFTGTYTTKAGAVYYFCYELGYLPLDNDEYLVVKREMD